MAKKLYPDTWLFAATIGLALFGVVMVYAPRLYWRRAKTTAFLYVIKQAIWTSIGLVAMLIAMQVDYHRLRDRRVVYGLLTLTVFMLLAVFSFPAINGARRWIKFQGFSVQPSEVSKLALAIFLAYFLEKRFGEEREFWRTFIPAAW